MPGTKQNKKMFNATDDGTFRLKSVHIIWLVDELMVYILGTKYLFLVFGSQQFASIVEAEDQKIRKSKNRKIKFSLPSDDTLTTLNQ